MKARSNEVVGKTNNQFFSPVKPGSYMLLMYLRSNRWYHLGYFSDE